MKRPFWTFCLATIWAMTPWSVRAEPEEHTVLIAGAPNQSALCQRLRTELTLGGWLVVELPEGERGPDRVPDEVARRVHASVAMRVDGKGNVELWVIDPELHSTIHHEAIDTDPSQGVDVVSLRVVEVLRARLLKLGVPIPEAPGPPGTPDSADAEPAGPPAPVERASPVTPAPDAGAMAREGSPPTADRAPSPVRESSGMAPAHGVDVFAAPLVAYSPGGVGWSGDVAIGAHYVADGAWALGVSAALPVAPSAVTQGQGTVTVRWGWLGAAAERRFRLDRVGLSAGAFAGVLVERLDGDARPPYRSSGDWIAAGAFLGSAGVRFPLSDALHVRLDGSIGAVAPRPVVVVADRVAASWGRPLLLASLGLEWELFRSKPSRSGEPHP